MNDVLLHFSTCIAGQFDCLGESCEKRCEDDEFQCKDLTLCIHESNVCDTVMDCRDGSDEYNCSM